MDLVPCGESARQSLVNQFTREDGTINQEAVMYIARTFPDILLDLTRLLVEQATNSARKTNDLNIATRQQLRPYFMFGFLLGKAPQITNLMYNYFENSLFQPLPEYLYEVKTSKDRRGGGELIYNMGFDDELLRDVLIYYLKYLTYNPKWFSTVWNWSELGRITASHINDDLRYLAACCLSIITSPTRHQHLCYIQDLIVDDQLLIDLQIRYRNIYENTFLPVIETRTLERAHEFIKSWGGSSATGYQYCSQSLSKITNVLLLKRDINLDENENFRSKLKEALASFIPVNNLNDTISKVAYSISINKPCLIRGPTGSGKTAILDYIAAQTNRINPPEYIKVQISDQIDSKMIVGYYVCTEIPGQFEWQPGPLTQAMTYGSWIVFEDIDTAPSELTQVIHSVIENGNLSCVTCCPIKLDSPHPDFRIFFTQRVRKNTPIESLELGYGFIERLCDIVDVPDLNDSDLREIIEKKYHLGSITDTIIRLYGEAKTLANNANLGRRTKTITLRDLFKFCDRIVKRKLKSHNDKFSSGDLDAIMLDSVDCFLAHLARDHISAPVEKFGEALNRPSNEVLSLVLQRKPELREETDAITIGRVRLEAKNSQQTSIKRRFTLAQTKQCMQIMESIGSCIKNKEPVLLVGETGVGKTTIVQHLADSLKVELVVINLSQQSDSSDLLGGYRPVEMREILKPINDKFMDLFKQTYDAESNAKFLRQAENLYVSSRKCSEWLKYLKVVCYLCAKAIEDMRMPKSRFEQWSWLLSKAKALSKRMSEEDSSPMALAFSDGSLLRAVRDGNWILLDEINLAEPDVLQCLLLILDSMKRNQVYFIGGETTRPLTINPNFRIFACMNPSTDVGKRDLSVGIQSRFTEFYVDDITEKQDLRLIVESYMKTCLKPTQVENIVTFYQEIRARSNVLNDVSGNSPVYSLRTLCRALKVASQNVCHNIEKSLYESIKITFLQQINEASVDQVLRLMERYVFSSSSLKQVADYQVPMPQDNHQYLQVEGFWIQTSSQAKSIDSNYIITASVRKNLERLARIISLGQRRLPILIQGNTSVGKTSLIKYLAKMTGNVCFRINNHEHTDLQEYVGRYVLTENGDLQFREGLLVTAMRKGYWVILDELNLAPSELLEALNRVLDDNRELFIPETREVIKAHSKFLLFATQNPPQEYAGRKLLSRAFRNRFIELHFDELPHDELEEILHKRCQMAPQHAKKIVRVMKELQVHRRESGCFNGKNSFMTMRDLFRWGERYAQSKDSITDDFFDWDQLIASEGLILLEGRVRTINEADTVKSIIEKVFNRKLDRGAIYSLETPSTISAMPLFRHIYFTNEFKRLYKQLTHALKFREPVLLCGQTGCGKTTASQLFAELNKQPLVTYNCHLNTESSDFVGDVRPSRQQDKGEVGANSGRQMFTWVDGPLVQAMRSGSVFLMDEISLADDAVLERINSVLEPDRSITLTEFKGEEVMAKDSFRLIATMNPGGDYGKKELSPALRNRFTEIYCHNTTDIAQVMKIVERSLSPSLLKVKVAPGLLDVIKRFLRKYYKHQDIISLRDVLGWTKFLNTTTLVTQMNPLSIQDAIIHGAALIFFDQFGTCGHNFNHPNTEGDLKQELEELLKRLVSSKFGTNPIYCEKLARITMRQGGVKIGQFYLLKGKYPCSDENKFILEAPIVAENITKLVRALQLERPILLEGAPGAGKTSIVSALAKMTANKLVRINLSEQTDISDLFGSDLPDTQGSSSGGAPNDDTPRFCWHDGPMLRAIKDQCWILLDEMNLASQSVLEGLNACFDHRDEIYISELNRKFHVDKSSVKIFACQNPYNQGAARKGLPQSFLNRFTSIYIESHSPKDLLVILQNLYPHLTVGIIEKMIQFNSELSDLCANYEFNLRDMIYWCDLTTRYVREENAIEMDKNNLYAPDRFVQFVYVDRLRNLNEKNEAAELFEKVFGYPIYEPLYREIRVGEFTFTIARSILRRKTRGPPQLADVCLLKYQLPYLESISKALEFNRMPILVGQPGVGKRTMVNLLAGLTGNKLYVVGANKDMDTVELLGSFEQMSLQRKLVDLIDESKNFVMDLINSVPNRKSASLWTPLYKHIWSTLFATSIRDLNLSQSDIIDAYRFQLNQMEELVERVQPFSTDETKDSFTKLIKKIRDLKRKLLYNSDLMYSSGNFEWIDSVLVKSIKEGNWLMIENANLMSPATLDRLNSLVEPDGMLCLSEKGSVGPEGIECIRPHKDFRLILTMDQDNGELSRAMRNRGVEIYIRTRFYFEDFLMLLNQNGFEPKKDTACMTYCIMQTSYDTHLKITEEDPVEDGSLLAFFGLNYIKSLAHQIRRGLIVDKILADYLISYYGHKGFLQPNTSESISEFVHEKMNAYRQKYVVDLEDTRYNWRNMQHDLIMMSGGDATISMLVRDAKLFWSNISNVHPVVSGLLRPDEVVDNLDIVNSCTTAKIFLELATRGDLAYRKGLMKQMFSNYPVMMNIVKDHLETFLDECIPIIDDMAPRSQLLPTTEMYVDTRNSPDLHYYMQSLSYKTTLDREDMQNRWILSLHRIAIKMIIELIEEQSRQIPNSRSLWSISEQLRTGGMVKQDLIRPQAEIATDLYDLLVGILRVASDRCFEDHLVPKMLARFFWIGYFICKLRRWYNELELIALCNQIPMLWALTYQKVLVPIIKDCQLADLSYNNRKFSNRIQHICDFLDVNISKPSKIEKTYYKKVLNMHAVTTKRYESIGREVDKLFTIILGRYTVRSQALSLGSDNIDTLAASGLVWTNSTYMSAFYRVIDKLLCAESADEQLVDTRKLFEEARAMLMEKKLDYDKHEEWLKNDSYRNKCLALNRRRNAYDQFAPVWQVRFIQTRFSKLNPSIKYPAHYLWSLRQMLRSVQGIILSPRYYTTLVKFLQTLEERRKLMSDGSLDESALLQSTKLARQDLDLYTSFLVDHSLEKIVLDNQIVGWTKLRVTTSDLASSAPLIPEYSPILSLVGSYCLDIAHLKLNSYQEASPQLDSMLIYLWRAYSEIKYDSKHVQDLALAQKLMHLRQEAGSRKELVGSYFCGRNEGVGCHCIEHYIKCRAPKYNDIVQAIRDTYAAEDVPIIEKSINLIYFGFYNSLEYAPIFTLDPALRSREKLEVYKSELTHVKIDLNLRNLLHYWKTGENLRLIDVAPDEAKQYPFSLRVLIERRAKLEKSIDKLNREQTNRPKSDDGSQYYELRKEIEVNITRYTSNINSLITDLLVYVRCKKFSVRVAKLSNLVSKCRMLIKSLEKSITQLKSDYMLYSDLLTNYLVGMSFVLQGMRRLYSRMEQKLQLSNNGFSQCLVEKFATGILGLFSFANFTTGNLESVNTRRALYPLLSRICPSERVSYIQSLLLRTILVQLNHHIVMTPSDIKRCIPIVRNIADLFHGAWLERKNYLEEQRKKQEELYQYKTSRTSVGSEISLERQEFIDICTKFPTYEHHYQDDLILPSAADEENCKTEAKIINLYKSVDISMCIDICKAHYKFMKEASLSLLGQTESSQAQTVDLRPINMDQLIKLEAEIFYTVVRQCILSLDRKFDSASVECHLLQASELRRVLARLEPTTLQPGSLKNSIDILDEDIFDIYHHANPYEALKFQELLTSIEHRITNLKGSIQKSYDNHPNLASISRLIARISSFLITDPLMKFVSGAHILLQKLDDWNQPGIPRENRITSEYDEVVSLITSWRELEVKCWRNSLHRVKRKYIDDTLCDLWFRLYELFEDPIKLTRKMMLDSGMIDEDLELTMEEHGEYLYQGFIFLIKEFFESATLGDYQLRLDLVFSFAIQSRFAGLYEQAKLTRRDTKLESESGEELKLDLEKLTTYVYNIHRQYQGLMDPFKGILESEEVALQRELNEQIRVVCWQGRSNLWEIKSNFRISQRKINKVMTKYLEVLRRPFQQIKLQSGSSEQKPVCISSPMPSERLASTIKTIQINVESLTVPAAGSIRVESLRNSPSSISIMKDLSLKVHKSAESRFLQVLVSLEEASRSNLDYIANFHSHKVGGLVLKPRDSKEVRREKLKQCRQMYHSKKFAMQAVFKNLQQLGVSFQRGLNNEKLLDKSILSLEPLRGMLQHQSRHVLTAASELVEDSLIIACNELYKELMTRNQSLLSQNEVKDLSSDQIDRVQGCAYDMVLDIIVHNKNAAIIYKHLMDIQASVVRLRQLEALASADKKVVVYNFNRVHNSVRQFNELVSKAFAATSKLEKLMDCFKTVTKCNQMVDDPVDMKQLQKLPDFKSERAVLKDLINEVSEDNSLMTQEQYSLIQNGFQAVRKEIVRISCELRDKLNHTNRNYLYSDDDIQHLNDLYDDFVQIFEEQLVANIGDRINTKPGTILGSLRSLLDEAQHRLKPLLEPNYLRGSSEPLDLQAHPNIDKLQLRLRKLAKQAKLAVQGVYKSELDHGNQSSATSEATRRRLKPFNHIDSTQIRDLLRPAQVALHTGNCFMTLNLVENCIQIDAVISALAPILSIYTQNVACLLNVVLEALNLKLINANQLVSFFIELVVDGFGLPCKINELEGEQEDKSNAKSSEDNVGFGEGGEGKEDASKKLEFESQLDELKKDGDEQKEEQQQQEEDESKPVEAHDDGVEMTEDFDAKAEGADNDDKERDENGLEEEDEECSPEDEERLKELDKEMGSVENDEGQLDQNLWNEEDDLPGEDEGEDQQEDLRQADADPSLQPELDEKEFQAKNQELAQSTTTTTNTAAEELTTKMEPADQQQQQQQEGGQQEEATGDDIENDANDNDDEDARMEEEVLETIQAVNDSVEMQEEDEEEVNDDDELDMDDNEAESSQKLGDNEPGEPGEQVDEADETVGELKIDDQSADSVPQSGADSSMDPEAGNADSHGQANEPMADDQPMAADELKQQQAPGGSKKQELEDREAAGDDREEVAGEDDDDDETVGGQQSSSKHAATADEESGERSSKRTLAERSSLEPDSIKRQKIADAVDDSERKDMAEGDVKAVQHTEGEGSHEVIDLVSVDSDDDELLNKVDERLEQAQNDRMSSSKPRDLKREEEDEEISELLLDENDDDDQADDEDDAEIQRTKSSYNTNLGLLKYISHRGPSEDQEQQGEVEGGGDLMERIDTELNRKPTGHTEHESLDTDILVGLWQECVRETGHLVHELCQQLQIVLQPTKVSKYRGDYKSGKRLNMRKIISYIASHYRKDKIWLRRTKPCKRAYNICLAVDNSSSMSENNCRQITYQSLALLAKSLAVIEAGSLQVISFGEQVRCIHEFGQPYVDAIGAQWLRELRFNESKTSYKRMLKYSCESFAKQARLTQSSLDTQTSVNQLLVIISDGRNVTSEAEEVKLYQKELRSMGVLTLFVIVDDLRKLESKSIVELKTYCKFGDLGRIMNYMDMFPFPFYVILRQLDSMPSILGEALRQWFELVVSSSGG